MNVNKTFFAMFLKSPNKNQLQSVLNDCAKRNGTHILTVVTINTKKIFVPLILKNKQKVLILLLVFLFSLIVTYNEKLNAINIILQKKQLRTWLYSN